MDSEKVIEKQLREKIKSLGGWSIKMEANYLSGLPDRICLLPGGIIFFVELKSEGKKPSKIQLYVHRKLSNLGFNIFVIDSIVELKKMINRYE